MKEMFCLIATLTAWHCSLPCKSLESNLKHPSTGLVEDWRQVSRRARTALERDQYDEAEKLYLQALQNVPRDKKYDQVVCDLKINLAETLRRKETPEKALQVLNGIRKLVYSASVDDPTLPARYWRRYHTVQISLGDFPAAAQALENAFAIVRQHFPVGSKYYMKNLENLVSVQLRSNQPERVLRSLQMVRADSNGKTLNYERANQAIVPDCCRAAIASLNNQELDQSAEILQSTGDLFIPTSDPLKTWTFWLVKCAELNKKNKFHVCEESVGRVMKRAHRRNLYSIEIEGHLCLFVLRVKQNREEAAKFELRQVTKVLERLRNRQRVDSQLVMRVAEPPLRLIVDYNNKYSSSLSGESNMNLAYLAFNWSSVPPQAVPTASFANLHCEAGFHLAKLLIEVDQPTKAQQTLNSISRQAISISHRERDLSNLEKQVKRIGLQTLSQSRSH